MITWTKIDPDNLPQGEVLVINDKLDSIIGYVTISVNGKAQCESEYELLQNATHYSLINKPESL